MVGNDEHCGNRYHLSLGKLVIAFSCLLPSFCFRLQSGLRGPVGVWKVEKDWHLMLSVDHCSEIQGQLQDSLVPLGAYSLLCCVLWLPTTLGPVKRPQAPSWTFCCTHTQAVSTENNSFLSTSSAAFGFETWTWLIWE